MITSTKHKYVDEFQSQYNRINQYCDHMANQGFAQNYRDHEETISYLKCLCREVAQLTDIADGILVYLNKAK